MRTINHGSIHHADWLINHRVIAAVSHDEVFGVYDVGGETSHLRVSDSRDGVPISRSFGDLRPQLDCQYVIDIASIEGAEVVVSGSTSNQTVTLTPFNVSDNDIFDMEKSIVLPGGHGEEIVRSITYSSEKSVSYTDPRHSTLYTAGEDANIKAWRIPGWNEMEDGPVRKKRRK